MKNHLTITISDFSGSRHFKIQNITKRLFGVMVALGLIVIPALLSFIYYKHEQSVALHNRNAYLEQELTRFNNHNALLIDQIATHVQAERNIDQGLSEIERLSEVETADGERSDLAQRMRNVSRFYSTKEDEYTEIGNRVQKVETLIQLKGVPQDGTLDNLAARVENIAYNTRLAHMLYSNIPSGFPTRNRTITSSFGMRVHPVTNIEALHRGADVRARVGTKVRATANGIVRTADSSDLSGNRVILQHNYGFEAYYAHLHKMHVKPGDIVHKGQVIGISGNSGQSAAPHLHYEIHYLKKPIDPSNFLRWGFGSQKIFTQAKEIQWSSLTNLISNQITQQTLQLSQLDPVSPEKLK